jgi:hypothetical protein
MTRSDSAIALFTFFQGAAYSDDEAFAARLREDPLANAAARRHAAGLRRDDAALLTFASEFVEKRVDQVGGLRLELYAPAVVDSSSSFERELETAPPVFTEREIDDHVDHLADVRAGRRQSPPSEHTEGRRLNQAVALLSQVLPNTELSTELELKQRALRTATAGWVATGAQILDHAARTGVARQMLARLGAAQDEDDDTSVDELLPIFDEILRRLVVLMIAAGMSDLIASRHMEAVVREAVADEALMSDPVTAFLLAILYARLGLSDWPEQLRTIHERHRDDELVASGLRAWALTQYRTTPDEREATRLEGTLVAIYRPSGVGHGGGAVVSRGKVKDDILNKLRSQRAESHRARNVIEPKLDPLDVEDELRVT